jgi:aerobic carbon-monoxide dehydrogenase small subunit
MEKSTQKKHIIQFTVNREPTTLLVDSNELLINMIRDRLGLTGTKYGCGTGQCAACTVLVNGQPVLGCLTLAVSIDGSEIVTAEGVASPDGGLDPIQEAFIDNAAIQCGFCTPGMVLVSKHLLETNPTPNEDEIREHIKGNLCRCTGYHGIVKAIKSCADQNKGDEPCTP